MIVKNESRIIERLLKSVLPIIDSYCICDTGSTDNTIDLIKTFFANNKIPGIIVREPFKDFAYNRTFALKSCIGLSNADYILLMDADMTLRINKNVSISAFKQSLTHDVYYLYQGSDTFFYKNVRIVKNNPEYYYWGVTHEFLKTPNGTVTCEVSKDEIFIDDIGDGGAKTDKYERDIRLLLKGLEENPNNDRYTFYLANSYNNIGQYEKSIEYYKKRIELGGWIEEVWYSYYMMGKCYKELNDLPNAIHSWLEGYQHFPNRVENLYQLVHHYRCSGKNILAYAYYEIADYERNKDSSNDHLFLQKEIYDYKLDYEFTIIAYYRNPKNYDIVSSCMKVLSNPNAEESICLNVLSNYKFYVNKLTDSASNEYTSRLKLLNTIGDSLDIDRSEFNSSTPSVSYDPSNKKLILNLRFVNYSIDDKGGYVNKDNITTINVVAIIDVRNSNWKKEKEFILNYDKSYDNRYVGLEDVRLFTHNGSVLYNSNRGLGYSNMVIEHGSIDLKTQKTRSNLLDIIGQHHIEKNWVMFENADRKLKMIYNWKPLKIGDVEDYSNSKLDDQNNPIKQLKITHQFNTPTFFKWIRGSTNGVTIDNEIWFICHIVSYEDRRYYYHIVVALDNKTLEVKRYSRIFTFEKEKVEYTLGFVYLEESRELLIGYSLMDRETKYITVPKDTVEGLFN